MAGAFTAVSGDSTCIFWNPAACVKAQKRMFGLHFTPYLGGTKVYGLTYLEPALFRPARSGIELLILDYGTVQQISVDSTYSPSYGAMAHPYAMMLLFPFAYTVTSNFGIGLSMKIGYESVLGNLKAYALAIDAPALYLYYHEWGVGLTVMNLGLYTPYSTNPIPSFQGLFLNMLGFVPVINLGVSYTVNLVRAYQLWDIDISYDFEGYFHTKLGFEYGTGEFNARAGLRVNWAEWTVKTYDSISISAGVGVYLGFGWKVNYSILRRGLLSSSFYVHNFSLEKVW